MATDDGSGTFDFPQIMTVGEPWTGGALPPGDSFGWHGQQPGVPGTLLLSLSPRDDAASRSAQSDALTVGLVQHGRLAVLLLDMPTFGMWDAPAAWVIDREPPEVVCGHGEHALFTLILVQDGIVENLRAFTVSPEFTRELRRVFAEMRAHGPLTEDDVRADVQTWQTEVPAVPDAWQHAIVTSVVGA